MAIAPNRKKVLFLPVIRGFYDRSMTKAAKVALRRAAEALKLDAIFPADDAFAEGLILGDADVRGYWETWKADIADIKALVAFSSDFMQERSVMDTARLLPEDVPVFLMVNNDDPQKQIAAGPVGDTLCGSLSVHHNLRMLGRRIVRTARIDMSDSDRVRAALGEFMRVAEGIETLRHMRVALLGVNPTEFATTFTNQMELFRLGFSLHTYELLDMWGDIVLGRQMASGDSYEGTFGVVKPRRPIRRDDPRVVDAKERLRGTGLRWPDDENVVDLAARLLVWLEDTFERDGIDAGAIHCWPEFERYFGLRPCAAAMLSNLLVGKPVVCEVDICHAIMAKLGYAMTGEPAVILDINNNGWEPRVFNVFHCSQTPPNWLKNFGEVLSDGTVQGVMSPGPFTAISAATSCDAFHATVFTGRFLTFDPGLRGSSGWAFVENFPEVLSAVEVSGIHHFVAMKGLFAPLVADVLRFKGLVVQDLSVEPRSLEEVEAEIGPPPD